MVGYTFIGVFSGSAPSKKATPTGEPALWNVYLKNGEKNYLIQKLDEDNIVTKEQYQISSIYFGINFRKVKNPNSDLNINRNIKNLTEKENTTDKNSDPEKIKAAYNALMKQKKENIEKAKNEKNQEINTKNNVETQKTLSNQQSSIEENTNEVKKQVPVKEINKQEEPKQKLSQQDFKINLNSQYINKNEIKAPQKTQYNEKTKTSLSISQSKFPTSKNTNYLPKTHSSDSHAVSDQNPYDEKFSIEKHGFDSILKRIEKAKNTPNKNLIPIRELSTTKSSIEEIFKNKNIAILSDKSKPNNDIEDQPFAIELEDDVFTKIENTNDTINNIPKTNIEKENSDEVLLHAKGNKSATSLSEKAKRLDNIIRAEFQMSLNHWNSLKRNLAMKQFHMLINKDANFVPAHKHMFTDFAIQLRKLNLHDLALAAAIRCTKLSPDDSHTFFNVARLYFELNKYEQANEFIDKTLQLEQDLIPAKKLSFIIKECLRRKTINK